MKEQLRLFWEKDDFEGAMALLNVWCRDAMQSGIKELFSMTCHSDLLLDHSTGGRK